MTIGVTGNPGAWKVASASSTITGDEALAGEAQIGAEEAW